MSNDNKSLPPFKPATTKNTVNISYSSSSASAAVAMPASAQVGQSVRICNLATDTVFVVFGVGTTTATTANGIPILNGTVEIIRIPDDAGYTYFAAIPNSSVSGKVYFTVGEGN